MQTGGVYALTAFSSSYSGAIYNLTNVGLTDLGTGTVVIGGLVGGVAGVSTPGNDFSFKLDTATNAPAPVLLSSAAVGRGLGGGTLTFTAVAAAVPEPASWVMMIGGFGMIGGAMRRKKGNYSFA